MENDRGGQPRQVRLPGFDERATARRPAYTWNSQNNGPPDYSAPPGRPRHEGIRNTRRASTWTAAALIAGVAVATGYLAHSIPTSGNASTTGTSVPAHSVSPHATVPVVTSGGSGGHGGDN